MKKTVSVSPFSRRYIDEHIVIYDLVGGCVIKRVYAHKNKPFRDRVELILQDPKLVALNPHIVKYSENDKRTGS
jgi:hypothetical protein